MQDDRRGRWGSLRGRWDLPLTVRCPALLLLIGALPAMPAAGETCAPVNDGILAVDVASVTITPEFRLAGQPFPVDPANAASLYLLADGLVQVHLGATDQPPGARRVLAGTYDLAYELESGVLLPRNGFAVFARDVPVIADGVLVVDVPSVVQAGSFLLDGAAFPSSDFEDARIYARKVDDGDETFLGNTHDGGYSLSLLPGDYEIVYRVESGGSVVPRNQNAVVETLAITATDLSADVHVASAVVAGAFSFNTAPAPDTPYENGRITLRTPAGDLVTLGDTRDQTYQVRLIPGVYDIYYDLLVSNGLAPHNHDSRLLAGVTIAGGTLNVDVPVKTVNGEFTVNGAPTPATIYEHGAISLADRQTGAKTLLGDTAEQAYSRRLVPGTYDVVYRALFASDAMPVNEVVELGRVAIPSGGLIQHVLDIDIPMTHLTLGSTLDGAPWPAGGTDRGELSLANADGSTSVVLGSTEDLPFLAPVASSFYRLGYAHVAGSGVPANEGYLQPGTFEVEGASLDLDLDLATTRVTPALQLDGSYWPSLATASGRLFLADGAGFLELPPTHVPPAASLVLRGTYDLVYAHDEGSSVPINALQSVTCVAAEDCLFCDGFESGSTSAWSG